MDHWDHRSLRRNSGIVSIFLISESSMLTAPHSPSARGAVAEFAGGGTEVEVHPEMQPTPQCLSHGQRYMV
jgi:hypothetical protein